MQGRHCNFCNAQIINSSRTPLFAHDKAKCAIESAFASFFAPHTAPFSPVLSLSEILLNHVSPVTHAAALILAPDSFVRPSAPFVLPYPSPVRPFAAFVFVPGSSGRASAAFVFAPGSSGRLSASFIMPCIGSVYDLNKLSKIDIALPTI